jgi:hypothetical protein
MTPAGARLSVSCCFHTWKLRAKAPQRVRTKAGAFLFGAPCIVRPRPVLTLVGVMPIYRQARPVPAVLAAAHDRPRRP